MMKRRSMLDALLKSEIFQVLITMAKETEREEIKEETHELEDEEDEEDEDIDDDEA